MICDLNVMSYYIKLIQVEDGIPSYMKGGFSDRILFGTTLILTAVGLVMSGEVLYKLSYPAKE